MPGLTTATGFAGIRGVGLTPVSSVGNRGVVLGLAPVSSAGNRGVVLGLAPVSSELAELALLFGGIARLCK